MTKLKMFDIGLIFGSAIGIAAGWLMKNHPYLALTLGSTFLLLAVWQLNISDKKE